MDSVSAYYAGGLLIESRQPTSVTNVACRECDWPPCCIHTYTVYTPIGGKGRCRTSCDLQDHSTQARKSASEISTLALKPMRKDTRSPKQEQSVAPQNGPRSRQKILKKKERIFSDILCVHSMGLTCVCFELHDMSNTFCDTTRCPIFLGLRCTQQRVFY